MRVGHNLSVLETTRLLNFMTMKRSSIAEKLTSGYKLNKSGDNSAGLGISEKMRAQIIGLNQAYRNTQDGISFIETADGALNEVHNILQRVRELSVQASNYTSTKEDRQLIESEVNELTEEINKILEDTEWNTIKIFDGSLSRKEDEFSIIYIEDSYSALQVEGGIRTDTTSDYDKLKRILKEEIVPQAVSKIIETYSSAFSYLSSSSIGIGLRLEDEPDSSKIASVGTNVLSEEEACVYRLTINLPMVLDKENNIKNRKELEAVVAHEFIHGFMDEALTCGMAGIYPDGEECEENRFPLWFVEGMAQTAAGGYANFNDFVNEGLKIKSDSTLSYIENTIKGENRLNSDKRGNLTNGIQAYGTGYLACMYLGYLASGTDNISERNITLGLDRILKDLIIGKSFNDVIKEVSDNKYNDVLDFQEKFGDDKSCRFIKKLTKRVGEGNGSLVAGNYTTDDILPDNKISTSLFKLSTTYETVINMYPHEVRVLSGGGLYSTGLEPISGYNDKIDKVRNDISGLVLQVGANSEEVIGINIDKIGLRQLNIDNISVVDLEDASNAIKACNEAIEMVSKIRSKLGSYQNRLEHTISNLNNSSENLQQSESRIRDLDMAEGITEYFKYQILIQAEQAMLNQANQTTNNVLHLLR